MKINPPQTNIVYISVGSNMGDKLANCRNGMASLNAADGIQVQSVSRYYLTEPMGYLDQPWFVNAAARVRTALTPQELLAALKSFETIHGRVSGGVRFGPRTLDFDIIFYNDMILETPHLVVPHPRMHEREFVLRPIFDLAPEMIHPVLGKSIRQLLADLDPERQQCIAM